jgi:hypothetical protein
MDKILNADDVVVPETLTGRKQRKMTCIFLIETYVSSESA